MSGAGRKGQCRMEVKNLYGHSIRSLYPDPPEEAAGFHPVTGQKVMVTRGQKGFEELPDGFDVDIFNRITFVTPEIQVAMFNDAGVVS